MRQVFTVDLLELYAAKGRGAITCMAAGNDVIVLGTSKGWIIRHDFGVGDSYGTFYLFRNIFELGIALQEFILEIVFGSQIASIFNIFRKNV